MSVFAVFCVSLAQIALADSTRLAAGAKHPTIVYGARPAAENDDPVDHGIVLSPDQRHARPSAFKSPLDDNRTGANPDPAAASLPPAVVRSEHAGSPYAHSADTDRGREKYAAHDQRPAYTTITTNGVSRWKSPRPLMRLKHRPVIVDLTDVIATDDSYDDVRGSRNGGVDYSDYEDEGSHINIPTGGSYVDNDGMAGWYGEIKQPPVLRRVKLSMNPRGIGIWAMIKIGLAKLKTFKVIKILILLAVKLKLLSLFKFFLITKLLVFGNFKLLLLPFLPSLWSKLVTGSNFWSTITNFGRNTTAECMSISTMSTGNFRNMNGSTPELKIPTDMEQSIGTTFVPKLVQFVTSVQSARCVERTACYAASFMTPSFGSIWMSGVLPSLVDYIPYRKLKLYMTTFKEVSDIRLENIFIKPSAEDWLKWCGEHYQCEEKTRRENDN